MAEPARQLNDDGEPEVEVPIRSRNVTTGRARVKTGASGFSHPSTANVEPGSNKSQPADTPSRANLHGLEGGGQGDGTPLGNLAPAPEPIYDEEGPAPGTKPEAEPGAEDVSPGNQPVEQSQPAAAGQAGRPALSALPGGQEGDGAPAGNLAAAPNEPVYDEPTGINPSTPGRPDLKAMEGGAAAGAGQSNRPHLGSPDEKDKAPSRDDLANAEEQPDTKANTEGNAPEDDSFYKKTNKANKKRPGRIGKFFPPYNRATKVKALFGGGIVGTIMALILFFTLSSGPFQFIHLAQLLEQFHFATQQEQSDDRSLQEFRWLRYKVSRKVYRSNLGTFQNYIADKLDTKMRAAGVETVYNNTTFGTNYDGFIVDPSKDVGKELGIQGQSEDEIRQFFKENYPDVNISFDDPKTGKAFGDGRFFADMSKLNSMVFTGKFKTASLNRTFLKASNLSGIGSYLGARIMTKRAGVTLHAITQQKIIDKAKAFKDFLKGWQDVAENGTGESVNEAGAADTNSEDEANAERFSQTGESEGVTPVSEGKAPSPEGTNTEEGLSMKAKITGGGALALAAACQLKGIDSAATTIKEAKVVYPLVREATTIIAFGNQVMDGQDLTAEQAGFFNSLLNGPSTQKSGGSDQTSWYDAASIQAELGHGDAGVDPSNTLKDINKNSPFHFLNTGIAEVILGGTFGLCSTAAQIIGAVLAPGSALIGYIIGQFGPVQHLYDTAAQWAAGKPLNLLDRGPDFGNDINYGARLAANAQAVSDGGRELSDTESNQLALYEANLSQQNFQNHSLAYQLFNPYDDRSAISKLIDNTSPSFTQNMAKMGSAFLNFGHIFASIGQIFSPPAQAAGTPYYYGFPQYGFSADEMNNPLVTNPYKNADDVVNTILPEHPQYIQRAQECFDVTIDPSTYSITSFGTTQIDASSPAAIKMNFFQQPGSAGFNADCVDSSTDWLQVRFYIFDTQTMASTTCYLGDDSNAITQQACADVGFGGTGSSSEGSAGGSTAGDGTVPGNVQQLAQQILANPNISYPLDASSPNGSTKAVLQALAAGQKAPVTCRDGSAQGVTSTDMSPSILEMVLDLGNQTKIGVNALSDKCHTTGSNHYKGQAVDFECISIPFDVTLGDSVASKYGLSRNSETCSANQHWHYSTNGQ